MVTTVSTVCVSVFPGHVPGVPVDDRNQRKSVTEDPVQTVTADPGCTGLPGGPGVAREPVKGVVSPPTPSWGGAPASVTGAGKETAAP